MNMTWQRSLTSEPTADSESYWIDVQRIPCLAPNGLLVNVIVKQEQWRYRNASGELCSGTGRMVIATESGQPVSGSLGAFVFPDDVLVAHTAIGDITLIPQTRG
jgi:hypothetical protein